MILNIFTYFCFFHMWLTLIPFLEASPHNEDDESCANESNGNEEITSPFKEQKGPQTKRLPRHRVVKYAEMIIN